MIMLALNVMIGVEVDIINEEETTDKVVFFFNVLVTILLTN